jgi:hypothetical protein
MKRKWKWRVTEAQRDDAAWKAAMLAHAKRLAAFDRWEDDIWGESHYAAQRELREMHPELYAANAAFARMLARRGRLALDIAISAAVAADGPFAGLDAALARSRIYRMWNETFDGRYVVKLDKTDDDIFIHVDDLNDVL